MNRSNRDDCKRLGKEFVTDFNQAHKLFLNDQYIKATIETLKVVENSSRKAYGNRYCPLNIIPRTQNAALYLRFYFQQQKSLFFTDKISSLNTSTPTDAERSILLHSSQSIASELSEICRKSACTSNEKQIISFANALVGELNKQNISVNLITTWLLGIKSNIAADFISSNQTRVLSKFNDQVLNLLYITQPYMFNESELNIPQKTQAGLLNLILKEKHPASICSVVLFSYYGSLEREHSQNKSEYLVTYVAEHNKLFEYLNDSLFYQNFYNTFCTIDKIELFDVAFRHAEKVKAEIMALLY